MKMFRFVVATIVLLLAVSAADLVVAASKKKPSPTPSQVPTIASVTADSITVTEAKGAKTLTITQFTEITVNGQRGTAADLKPGMTVTITLGTDPSKASRINATGK
jgi:hypothetical protein